MRIIIHAVICSGNSIFSVLAQFHPIPEDSYSPQILSHHFQSSSRRPYTFLFLLPRQLPWSSLILQTLPLVSNLPKILVISFLVLDLQFLFSLIPYCFTAPCLMPVTLSFLLLDLFYFHNTLVLQIDITLQTIFAILRSPFQIFLYFFSSYPLVLSLIFPSHVSLLPSVIFTAASSN